jgi:predicted O-methyltransferase YrrM
MRPESGINGLIDICNHIQKDIEVKTALEVGSYLGESTIVFAEKFNNLDVLYAVDPFNLNFNLNNLFDENNINEVENIFKKNIKKYPVIKHIKKDSKNASVDFNDGTFDFIYIDGCHQYECVYEDVSLWKPKVKNDGYISFHDIDWSQVQEALSHFFDLQKGFITQDNSITFKISK